MGDTIAYDSLSNLDINSTDIGDMNDGSDVGTPSEITAESYALRQAVAAAAEARHNARSKTIPKSTLMYRKEKLMEKQRQNQQHEVNTSGKTRRAVTATKQAEKASVANLGFNPYETQHMTSGQSRTASVAASHGELDVSQTSTNAYYTNIQQGTSRYGIAAQGLNPAFEDAFATLVTSHPDETAILKSMTIMRKIIFNATTKGQQRNDEGSSKYRQVRLSNPKVASAITNMPGALDLMMLVGFELSENEGDGETYLVFSLGKRGPEWLNGALSKMEAYGDTMCSE